MLHRLELCLVSQRSQEKCTWHLSYCMFHMISWSIHSQHCAILEAFFLSSRALSSFDQITRITIYCFSIQLTGGVRAGSSGTGSHTLYVLHKRGQGTSALCLQCCEAVWRGPGGHALLYHGHLPPRQTLWGALCECLEYLVTMIYSMFCDCMQTNLQSLVKSLAWVRKLDVFTDLSLFLVIETNQTMVAANQSDKCVLINLWSIMQGCSLS